MVKRFYFRKFIKKIDKIFRTPPNYRREVSLLSSCFLQIREEIMQSAEKLPKLINVFGVKPSRLPLTGSTDLMEKETPKTSSCSSVVAVHTHHSENVEQESTTYLPPLQICQD